MGPSRPWHQPQLQNTEDSASSDLDHLVNIAFAKAGQSMRCGTSWLNANSNCDRKCKIDADCPKQNRCFSNLHVSPCRPALEEEIEKQKAEEAEKERELQQPLQDNSMPQNLDSSLEESNAVNAEEQPKAEDASNAPENFDSSDINQEGEQQQQLDTTIPESGPSILESHPSPPESEIISESFPESNKIPESLVNSNLQTQEQQQLNELLSIEGLETGDLIVNEGALDENDMIALQPGTNNNDAPLSEENKGEGDAVVEGGGSSDNFQREPVVKGNHIEHGGEDTLVNLEPERPLQQQQQQQQQQQKQQQQQQQQQKQQKQQKQQNSDVVNEAVGPLQVAVENESTELQPIQPSLELSPQHDSPVENDLAANEITVEAVQMNRHEPVEQQHTSSGNDANINAQHQISAINDVVIVDGAVPVVDATASQQESQVGNSYSSNEPVPLPVKPLEADLIIPVAGESVEESVNINDAIVEPSEDLEILPLVAANDSPQPAFEVAENSVDDVAISEDRVSENEEAMNETIQIGDNNNVNDEDSNHDDENSPQLQQQNEERDVPQQLPLNQLKKHSKQQKHVPPPPPAVPAPIQELVLARVSKEAADGQPYSEEVETENRREVKIREGLVRNAKANRSRPSRKDKELRRAPVNRAASNQPN
ncbi:UNVERIFIED_CONTAM: hypothetical protein HDU68_001817 [Siphonaria sp. JEL0065]|nr:hypothetical protein HDU68_001817 [Siphonaria sp. JEL0065]